MADLPRYLLLSQELGFEGVDKFATHFHDPVVGYVGKHKPFSSHAKKKHDTGPSAGRQQKERQRELPEEEKPPPRKDSPQVRDDLQQPYLPPHPQWQVPPPPPGAPPAGLPYPGGLPPAIPYPRPQPTGLAPSAFQPPRGQLPRQRSYSEPRGERYDGRAVPDDIGEIDSDSDIERGPKSMYSDYAPDRRREGRRRDDDKYGRTVEDREYYGPSATVQQMAVRTRGANRHQGGALVVSTCSTHLR
ncbi:uncharacterized protein N0V89_007331 [Didymosphaeria variabile]|uniref:Uncharacterized protein n=1 Tax=Didymosphaeria variabile TaxID=1932322 RepID=A0A9W9CA30_9PLEO|nr:uncharacterized protein N0V89_007331 [Didymosphaeria variabile]KAJ4351985.1 hypothetical protein N0V89_007331 [Didymosphaeria variabile]